MLPGLTVGPLKYSLSIDAAAAARVTVSWGFGVFNEMITTAADFDPGAREHLDWMEWGSRAQVAPAAPAVSFLAGGLGDDGVRQTRTKRVIKEVEDTFVFAITSSGAINYRLFLSAVVMLP